GEDAFDLGGEAARVLELEGGGEHGPTPAHVAHPGAVRYADAVVGRDVGAFATQRLHLGHGEAGRVDRHQEHGEALVFLRRLGVAAGEEEDVVGHLGERREHLLPVDDPLVAVAARPGAGRRHVRAGVGFAVAERDEQLAPRERPEDGRLLLRRAPDPQRGCHQHRRPDAVHRRLGPAQLLAQDGLLEHVEAGATFLLGPAGRHPAAGAEGTGEAGIVVSAGALHLVERRRGEVLGEKGASVLADGLDLVTQAEIHLQPPVGRRATLPAAGHRCHVRGVSCRAAIASSSAASSSGALRAGVWSQSRSTTSAAPLAAISCACNDRGWIGSRRQRTNVRGKDGATPSQRTVWYIKLSDSMAPTMRSSSTRRNVVGAGASPGRKPPKVGPACSRSRLRRCWATLEPSSPTMAVATWPPSGAMSPATKTRWRTDPPTNVASAGRIRPPLEWPTSTIGPAPSASMSAAADRALRSSVPRVRSAGL